MSRTVRYVSHINLSHGVTASRSERVAASSPVIAESSSDSGVSSASRSETSDCAAPPAPAIAALDSASTLSMKARSTSSSEPTLTCWQMIRYWISPSLAARAFLSATQMSRYLVITCSITGVHVRWRLDESTSCSESSAACCWPTCSSSSARLSAFSGLAKWWLILASPAGTAPAKCSAQRGRRGSSRVGAGERR